jgi:hypothetical protein
VAGRAALERIGQEEYRPPYPGSSPRLAVTEAGRRWRALALLIVLAAIGVVAADASASGTLPVAPTFLVASAANSGLQVKPKTITYTGDGTGFLSGANPRNHDSAIHWTRWAPTIALGTAFNQLDNCSPDCASGKFHGYQVTIELWRPRALAGTLVFTRMTIVYKTSRPPGEPRHYTFTDTYIGGTGHGYSWGPPTAQGYCVHTYGQPPAAGCQNIHALP